MTTGLPKLNTKRGVRSLFNCTDKIDNEVVTPKSIITDRKNNDMTPREIKKTKQNSPKSCKIGADVNMSDCTTPKKGIFLFSNSSKSSLIDSLDSFDSIDNKNRKKAAKKESIHCRDFDLHDDTLLNNKNNDIDQMDNSIEKEIIIKNKFMETYQSRKKKKELNEKNRAILLFSYLRLHPISARPCLGLLHFYRRQNHLFNILSKCAWHEDSLLVSAVF